jgi:hypothetical protein
MPLNTSSYNFESPKSEIRSLQDQQAITPIGASTYYLDSANVLHDLVDIVRPTKIYTTTVSLSISNLAAGDYASFDKTPLFKLLETGFTAISGIAVNSLASELVANIVGVGKETYETYISEVNFRIRNLNNAVFTGTAKFMITLIGW